MQSRTVLIVDDHPLFREGLKAIIAGEKAFAVIGEAGTAREALALAKDLKPDIMLVDLSLPDQSGIDLAREIRIALPSTRMIIVSMHSKVDYIVKAFQAGATGYVVKESAADRLLQGLAAVARGEYFMDSAVSHKVVARLMQSPEKDTRMTDATYETLTPREQEIMVMLAEDLPIREIADKLFISPKTVENHKTSIMSKLGLHSSIELVRYAAKLGLIDIDLWKQ